MQLEIQTEDAISRKKEICESAAYYLAYMYDISHNTPANEPAVIQILLDHILNDKHLSIEKYKYYIYNQEEQKEYNCPTEILFDNNSNTNKIEEVGYVKYEGTKIISYRKNNNTGKLELVSSREITGRLYLDRALSYNTKIK